MHRLAFVAVVLAACASPYKTGAADLTGITPQVQSAGAVSFQKVDGSGVMRLGWELQFFADGQGYDCLSDKATEVADLFIWTNQVPTSGSNNLATLPQTASVQIVPENPPTINGTAVGHFSIQGMSGATGELDLTDVPSVDDRFEGMIDAGATSNTTQDGVTITGSFTAPVCQ